MGCVIAMLGACAMTVPKRVYTPEELHDELARRLPGEKIELVVPHKVTSQHIALARRAVMREDTQQQRVAALIRAMFDARYFGLSYAAGQTTSAIETLDRKRGNCVSLASVFVGLARGLGMDAHYLDASVRVHDVRRVGDLVVRQGHVTAVVRTDDEVLALDIGIGLRLYGLHRVMDDLDATALYYNNRGYEALGAARGARDWQRAAAYFLSAIRINPTFARAWNNLGVAYKRLGSTEDALLCYRMAIDLNDDLPSPHANAGRLLLDARRLDEAVGFLRAALERDPKSRHVRYRLAVALALDGQITQAIRIVKPLAEGQRRRGRRLLRALRDKQKLYRRR